MSVKQKLLFLLAKKFGTRVSVDNELVKYEGYAFCGKIYFIPTQHLTQPEAGV